MAEVTVSQFAEALKVPIDRLLAQLDEAGIKVKGADDIISDEAKMELLTHLRRAHGRQEEVAAPRKITLKRKAQQEIKVASTQGRARTVNVEVRAKKTYLNRTVLEEEQRQRQEELDRVRQAEEAVRHEAERQENERRDAERREHERVEAEAQRRLDEEARSRAEAEEARLAEQRQHEKVERERQEAERRAAEPPKPAQAPRARAPEQADDRSKGAPTKYGRQELHVTSDASARFKKKQMATSRSRRHMPVSIDARGGG
ncbi:MAG: translation initiation factor IF-2 associated domain-containing protein, partial [Steroidobacteraceae bacterium]|nr:translation initiation factor IF-2 associated domain-containing protein [Steroidobacteraceae bacterium]